MQVLQQRQSSQEMQLEAARRVAGLSLRSAMLRMDGEGKVRALAGQAEQERA